MVFSSTQDATLAVAGTGMLKKILPSVQDATLLRAGMLKKIFL